MLDLGGGLYSWSALVYNVMIGLTSRSYVLEAQTQPVKYIMTKTRDEITSSCNTNTRRHNLRTIHERLVLFKTFFKPFCLRYYMRRTKWLFNQILGMTVQQTVGAHSSGKFIMIPCMSDLVEEEMQRTVVPVSLVLLLLVYLAVCWRNNSKSYGWILMKIFRKCRHWLKEPVIRLCI